MANGMGNNINFGIGSGVGNGSGGGAGWIGTATQILGTLGSSSGSGGGSGFGQIAGGAAAGFSVAGPWGAAVGALNGFLEANDIPALSDAINVIKTGDLSNWGASGNWENEKQHIANHVMKVISMNLDSMNRNNAHIKLTNISKQLGWQYANYKDAYTYHSKATLTKEVKKKAMDAITALKNEVELAIIAKLKDAGVNVKSTVKFNQHASIDFDSEYNEYNFSVTQSQWELAMGKSATSAGTNEDNKSIPQFPPAYKSWHKYEKWLYDRYYQSGNISQYKSWTAKYPNKNFHDSFLVAMGLKTSSKRSTTASLKTGNNLSKFGGIGFLPIVLIGGVILWATGLLKFNKKPKFKRRFNY